MKLNYDCVRDVLIFLEDNLNMSFCDDGVLRTEEISLIDVSEALPAYSIEDVAHSLINLGEAGLINMMSVDSKDGICEVYAYEMNFEGHEFLAKIRADTVWNSTKARLEKLGSFSVYLISNVAEFVLSEMISERLL